MAIHIDCSFCGEELGEPGGLFFEPPVDGRSEKKHLCRECSDSVMVPCRKNLECAGDIGHRGDCYK